VRERGEIVVSDERRLESLVHHFWKWFSLATVFSVSTWVRRGCSSSWIFYWRGLQLFYPRQVDAPLFFESCKQITLIPWSLNHASSTFLLSMYYSVDTPLIIIIFHCGLLFTSLIHCHLRGRYIVLIVHICWTLVICWLICGHCGWERHGVLSSWMQSAWFSWAITLFI
jgi:hypothetical protein